MNTSDSERRRCGTDGTLNVSVLPVSRVRIEKATHSRGIGALAAEAIEAMTTPSPARPTAPTKARPAGGRDFLVVDTSRQRDGSSTKPLLQMTYSL